MEVAKILASAGLAASLYLAIGIGIDRAIAAQSPPPKEGSTLPGGSRR